MVASTTNHSVGFLMAATAGFLAAFSSVFGKFAMDSSSARTLVAFLSLEQYLGDDMVLYLLRVLSFGGIFACNALMFVVFVKAMHYTTSINAVVTNFSFNFFLSALFGNIFFGEHLSLKWFVGASFIIAGVVIMKSAKGDLDSKDKEQPIESEERPKRD
eukprot:TRINITY_DN12884_c0_g1_i1.p1 TRINITY_DN12884_c0_g1~~TRINITY_DN12884_c0_g1_i1.p1  ORF type:complete len:171 (+),score=40.04 TRINITY_DN12884_c0_g1_i1:37-513(+)